MAANRARVEVLRRFRHAVVETKTDGSPVTEADRRAETVLRAALHAELPEFPVVGEEFGGEPPTEGPYWVVDPIDGTISFARGIPLFATLIALISEGKPVVGLIDLPVLGERYVGWRGGGCRRLDRDGREETVRVSSATNIEDALIAHGDAMCFESSDKAPAFRRMAREIPMLRGYTDAFGHAMVLSGGVDAMVDLQLDIWDTAATRLLIPEAGGRCEAFPVSGGKTGLIFGAPVIVDHLLDWLGEGADDAG